MDQFDGPIPGENKTSDSRNYPWRRPPENTNIDGAVETLTRSLKKESTMFGIVSMLKIGVPVSFITELILMKGIEAGKWSIDLAILLAGPLSHMIVIMARGYDLPYDLGIEENTSVLGAPFFKSVEKDIKKNSKTDAEIKEQIDEVAATGFMAGESGGVA